MDTTHFVYPFKGDGHLSYFQFGAITNNAATTIHIHVLSGHIFSFLLGEYPEVEFLLVWYGCMVMNL